MTFSIIIPVYNGENHLKECLDSIVDQSYRDFEVIIIDDGSTDDSANIYSRYCQDDARFKAFFKENGGVSSARNYGIKMAKGEYVTFVDADDFLSKEYLIQIKQIVELHHPDIIVNSSFYQFKTKELEIEYKYRINNTNSLNAEDALEFIFNRDYPTAMWMSVYKHSISERVLLDETIHYYEDLDYQLRIVRLAKTITINHYSGYYYRSGSSTHTKLTSKNLTCYILIDKLLSSDLKRYAMKIKQLKADFIISNSITGAIDRDHDVILDSILKEKANQCLKEIPSKYITRKKKLILIMMRISPRLFYRAYRMVH